MLLGSCADVLISNLLKILSDKKVLDLQVSFSPWSQQHCRVLQDDRLVGLTLVVHPCRGVCRFRCAMPALPFPELFPACCGGDCMRIGWNLQCHCVHPAAAGVNYKCIGSKMPALVLSLQKSSWIMPPQLKCWSWSPSWSWWWSSSWSWWWSSWLSPCPRWQKNQCSHCIPEGKEMPPMQGQWLQVLGWTASRQDVRGRKSGAEQFLTCQFAWAGHSTSKVKRMQKDAKVQNVIWCHLMSTVSGFCNSTRYMQLRASTNDQDTMLFTWCSMSFSFHFGASFASST